MDSTRRSQGDHQRGSEFSDNDHSHQSVLGDPIRDPRKKINSVSTSTTTTNERSMPQGKQKRVPGSKTLPDASLSTQSKIHCLEQLVSQVTPSNCTADIFIEALNHLQPELLPDSNVLDNLSPDDADNVRSAALAMALLSTVFEACDDGSDLNEIVVDKLAGFIHTLCLWIEVLLGLGLCYPMSTLCGVCARSHAHFTYSNLLLDLQSIDEGLAKALFASHTFFHILIVLWMTDDGGEEHRVDHVLEFQPASVKPPVVTLLLSFLMDDVGKEELFRYASMSPQQFTHDFLSVLRQRACKVRDTRLDEIGPIDVASFFEDLMYIIEYLTESDVFRRELSRMSYLYGFASILNTVSIEMKKHTPKDHHLLLDAAFQLTAIADDFRPYRAAKNWCKLVGGGFWALAVRLLSSVPKGNRYYRRLGIQCLKNLGRYTAYRSVLSSMLIVLLPEESIEGIPDHDKILSKWMQGLEHRKEALNNAENCLILCDNPACLPSSPSRHSSSKPKECSRCRSMVYCSEKCQKEDWKQLHRLECSGLREMRSLREESETVYHHLTRAFHVSIIESLYNMVIGRAEKSNAESPSPPLRERIIALDGVSLLDERCGFAELNKWEAVHAHTPDYLRPRLWPLIQSYRSGGDTDTVRLAEGLFPLGDELVDLVVVLRRNNERWEAVYSVAQYEDAGDSDFSYDSEPVEDNDQDGGENECYTDEGDDDDSDNDLDGGSDDLSEDVD